MMLFSHVHQTRPCWMTTMAKLTDRNSSRLCGRPVSALVLAIGIFGAFAFSDSGRALGPAVASKIVDIPEAGNITAIAFSADGEKLAMNVVNEKKVDEWSWRGQVRLSHSLAALDGYEGATAPAALSYSSTGQTLALLHESSVIGEGTRIDIWNSASGKRIRVLHPPDKTALQPGLAFTAGDRRIVALVRGASDTTADQFIEYNAASGSIEWGLRTAPFWPNAVAISPDGKLAALGGAVGLYERGPIWLIDLNAHRVVRKIDAFPADSRVDGLSFSPDGKRLAASASFNNVYPSTENLKIFSVSSGDQITGAVSPDQSQTHLSYAGNGAYLVDGAIYGAATIWDGSFKTPLQKIDAVMGVFAVSPDGHFVAVVTETGASIWEFRRGLDSALH